jgi:cytosine/adenosine deaminase-related metal-dependent hydrolase
MSGVGTFLLSGRIVFSDGHARQRYVLVREGIIERISRSRPPERLVADVREIVTGPQDWVFPGLIDLHTHAAYNILPLWRSSRAPFDHRHVWRRDASYRREIRNVSKALKGRAARSVFSELQAVAGGTVVMEQPRSLDTEEDETALLCRDTGKPQDLGLSVDRRIYSVVDFFRPDKNGRPVLAPGYGGKPGSFERYVEARESLQATLVHLGEGRSGFGTHRGVDPYTKAEVAAFIAHPSMGDVPAVRASRLAIIHGCGINVADSGHLDFLVDRDISVIWSPASNMLLYGDTLDVQPLIASGVTVALGSDWSPSGTKHVWEEAKFARYLLNAVGASVSDADVFKMVTTNPGRVLGLPRLGRIEEGAHADFFMLQSPVESDSALEVFFATTDRHVLATVVRGVPIYGDRAFLQTFGKPLQHLPAVEGRAVENKAVHLPASIEMEDFAASVDELEADLKAMEPKVLRSNLLVDSDVPYQRRFHELRAHVEWFGWNVKRWRREMERQPPPPVGRVVSEPAAVVMRVVPGDVEATSQALLGLERRLGLSGFVVARLPASRPSECPEALVLSAYKNRTRRDRAFETAGGRAANLIVEALLPQEYDEASEGEGVWFAAGESVDWAIGTVRVTVISRETGAAENSLVVGAHTLIRTRITALPGGGALAALVRRDYAVIWECLGAEQSTDDDLETDEGVSVVMHELSRPLDCKAALATHGAPPSITKGTCAQLMFERRDLFPW